MRSPEHPAHANVPLAPLTTLGVGGRARWFVRVSTVDGVAAAHQWALEHDVPLFVLGGGSNLVVSDAGFDGLVLHVALEGVAFKADANAVVLTAAAGECWDAVVRAAVARGLAGLECLSGIPGTVGGTPVQNVGAYGQEVASTIAAVTVVDRRSGQAATLRGDECGFSYRMSRFKAADAGRFIVCEVSFVLRPGPPTTTYPDILIELDRRGIREPLLAEVRAAVIDVRRRKGMVIDPGDPDTRSVGSFFMNPVVPADRHARLSTGGARPPGFAVPGGVKVPAAWLIEQAGFSRGYVAGAAALSSKHPLAIVNRGGATARDVLALATRIKRAVIDRFGIWLRPEPAFVGFVDDGEVAFLERAGR